MEKEAIDARKAEILALIRVFCTEKLDDEYYELCQKVLDKLGRKKKSVIFLTGQLNSWAAAVVHSVCTINFGFDKSQTVHCTVSEINDSFGTKTSTVSNKSKEIRDLLKMRQFDNEFATKKNIERNPFNNLVMVNGLIMSVKSLPEEFQILVDEARANGDDIRIAKAKNG